MLSAFMICALFILFTCCLASGNMTLEPRPGGWLLGCDVELANKNMCEDFGK